MSEKELQAKVDELFEEAQREQDATIQEAKEYMESGKFDPDVIMDSVEKSMTWWERILSKLFNA